MIVSPLSIAAELRQGTTHDAATFALLKARGVLLPALARSATGALDCVVSDSVVFLGGGGFEFARYAQGGKAERAPIIPARDRFGDLSDLVAWCPWTGRLASWLSRCGLLGEELLGGFRLDEGDGLTVHDSPFAWLASMREGVVVVDPDRGGPMLRDAELLHSASADHGLELRRIMTPRLPTITVPSIWKRKAA